MADCLSLLVAIPYVAGSAASSVRRLSADCNEQAELTHSRRVSRCVAGGLGAVLVICATASPTFTK